MRPNAGAARQWLAKTLGEAAVGAHFAAVSANVAAATEFGVRPDRIFGFWDWVGGRYSIWSAVGLSCAIGLGWPAFEALLAGAWAMDEHFLTAAPAANAPVLLALAHIYNRNALNRQSRAVIPYSRRLALLPAFLQQLEMESNGKSVNAEGGPVTQSTASVVFGDVGANSQHAFFQLLHQGVDIVPVDIIAVAKSSEGPSEFQAKLLANAIGQAEALMTGHSNAGDGGCDDNGKRCPNADHRTDFDQNRDLKEGERDKEQQQNEGQRWHGAACPGLSLVPVVCAIDTISLFGLALWPLWLTPLAVVRILSARFRAAVASLFAAAA